MGRAVAVRSRNTIWMMGGWGEGGWVVVRVDNDERKNGGRNGE